MTNQSVWNALNTAKAIGNIIEETECDTIPNTDLTELKQTVSGVRASLVGFVNIFLNELAFDICLQGVKESLEKIHVQLKKNANKLDLKSKIDIYRLDFLLRLQLDQFDAMFTKSPDDPEKIIHDGQGRVFWKNHFGAKCYMVPWEEFKNALEAQFETSLKDNESFLSPIIDFTRDNFVTVYEFSCFLKWFGPLIGSLDRLLVPLKAGFLSGFVPALEAGELLSSKEPGTFLIRMSKTQPGSFAVTFIDNTKRIRHCLLHHVDPFGVTLKNPPDIYNSLQDFVNSHATKLKTPLHSNLNTLPAAWVETQQKSKEREKEKEKEEKEKEKKMKDEKNAPPPETHERTCCVVCLDKEIETIFLECGHMACCQVCSPKLKVCPVCRSKIVRVVKVFLP